MAVAAVAVPWYTNSSSISHHDPPYAYVLACVYTACLGSCASGHSSPTSFHTQSPARITHDPALCWGGEREHNQSHEATATHARNHPLSST